MRQLLSDFSSISLHALDDRGSDDATPSEQNIISSSIERLPEDIFMQIVKLLEPKDAARLASVCQLWKLFLSDDKLWKYFFHNQPDLFLFTIFAETKLRYGFPLRTYPRKELSFMKMYYEQAKAPGAIIIDGGAGFCKFGWSKNDSPSFHVDTCEEFISIGSSLEANIHNFFAKIFERMHVSPSTQPVIITTPTVFYSSMLTTTPTVFYNTYSDLEASSDQCIEAIYSVLFKMNVPAFCKVNSASLAMFSERKTWGILVDIGFLQTTVYPIMYGEISGKVGVVSVGIGGFQLTVYLGEQLDQRNLDASSLSTVRSLKEKLCYVALDYEAELLKDTEASYRVDSNTQYTLKEERFRTGELLFQPHIGGMYANLRVHMDIDERGLHHAVAECVNKCRAVKMKKGHDWFKNIVLVGGTARLPGLAERLEKELRNILLPEASNGIHVIASPYGENAAWHGAKLVSNLSTFQESWCIKEPP